MPPCDAKMRLFYFLVNGVLALPRTVLLEFQALLDFLLIAFRVVINTLAHRALKFDEIILRHRIEFLSEIFWSRQSDLNRRPTVYKTVALPLSYAGRNRLVGRAGFEPAKAQGHLVYSQTRLTASVPTQGILIKCGAHERA
jgi:hypothetical protein